MVECISHQLICFDHVVLHKFRKQSNYIISLTHWHRRTSVNHGIISSYRGFSLIRRQCQDINWTNAHLSSIGHLEKNQWKLINKDIDSCFIQENGFENVVYKICSGSQCVKITVIVRYMMIYNEKRIHFINLLGWITNDSFNEIHKSKSKRCPAITPQTVMLGRIPTSIQHGHVLEARNLALPLKTGEWRCNV